MAARQQSICVQKLGGSGKANKEEHGLEMKTEKYIMSFTAGGLLHLESVKVAALYLTMRDWDKVREEVLQSNILQARTLNTLNRICREICSRLKTLNSGELDLLVNGSNQEQNYLLWLAVCRRYRFIRDFSIEVIRERFLSLRRDLTYQDYDAFFNAKAEWHEELERITAATHIKLRQVLFKMLREADLLAADNTISPAMLTPRLASLIGGRDYEGLSVFPITELELKERKGSGGRG